MKITNNIIFNVHKQSFCIPYSFIPTITIYEEEVSIRFLCFTLSIFKINKTPCDSNINTIGYEGES